MPAFAAAPAASTLTTTAPETSRTSPTARPAVGRYMAGTWSSRAITPLTDAGLSGITSSTSGTELSAARMLSRNCDRSPPGRAVNSATP